MSYQLGKDKQARMREEKGVERKEGLHTVLKYHHTFILFFQQ